MLPLNPLSIGPSPSPYSSCSSMAGNHLLISPELLAKEGLLSSASLKEHQLPAKAKADFLGASRTKEALFDQAYAKFLNGKFASLKWEYEQFCTQEKEWLDDFALYIALKEQYAESPWQEWPSPIKGRQTEVLKAFSSTHKSKIDKTKWLQFIFFTQWRQLKTYCHRLGIHLLGDMPFYVGSDSVDVWANPSLFSVDEAGTPIMVAGVPPDYFSKVGQKWGMPVYHWDKCKASNYAWWKHRFKKNMELFDVIRLDHFRAFASYYEVPAAEPNALNGTWKTGPGAEFLKEIRKELKQLPFVAEDLGEPDPEVDKLRDQFQLPGMKILQFAFEKDMAHSPHIPHRHSPHFLIYTGTHDNNTTVGWFRKNTNKALHKRIEAYTGKKVTQANVHEILIRLVYGSVGNVAILPMQDILGLDEKSCMNIPGTISHNWLWRLLPDQLSANVSEQLKEWTELYGRIPIGKEEVQLKTRLMVAEKLKKEEMSPKEVNELG